MERQVTLLDRLRRLASWADPVEPPPILERSPEAKRAFAPPSYRYGSTRTGLYQTTANQPDPGRLLIDGFRGVQATGARAIANRMGELELMVQEEQSTREGTTQLEEIDDHPLKAILRRPNALLSSRQLLKVTSYWLTQTGEAYWLIVTNGAGAPRELWPMSPAQIEKVSGADLPVDRFIFHGQDGDETYRLDEVVWMFEPDPADPFQGVGVVGPQATEYDALRYASQTTRSHFQNDAMPKLIMEAQTEADMPTPEQLEAFYADWQNRFNSRAGTNQGGPAIGPSGFNAKELSGMGNLEGIRALLDYMRDEMLMSLQVPRSILGDVVDANRAAADTNQLVFDRYAISPQAGTIVDALTYQLAQPYFGPQYRVAFRDFIQRDEQLRLQEENQDLTQKVRSINQVLSDRGQDPVDWGEQPVGTFGDQPYDPNGMDEEPGPGTDPFAPSEPEPDPEPEPDEEDEEEAPEDTERALIVRATARRVATRFTAQAEWDRVLQRDSVLVPRLVRAMRSVFGSQKAFLLENLEPLVAQLAPLVDRQSFLDDLFEDGEMFRLFRTEVQPILDDGLDLAGKNTLNALEVKPSLLFNEIAQRVTAEQGAQLITFVNDTTKRNIARTLSQGIGEGDSLDQLAGRVRRVFNQASKSRARTIARTETLTATQNGQLVAFDQSEVVEGKRWNHALFEPQRDWHRAIHGTVRRRGEMWDLNGERALAPGVGEGMTPLSARNRINCRCNLTPVLEGL